MKNAYFIKLNGEHILDDIFNLVNTIIYSIHTNRKIIVFNNDFFDLKKMNTYFKQYNILLVNKKTTQFKINAIFYGENDNVIDLTDLLKNAHIISGNTYLSNILVNDPSPNKPKQLYYNYSFDDNEYFEIYDDYIEKDIYFDIKNAYEYLDKGWIDTLDKKLFDELLEHIYFMSYYNSSKDFKENQKKINVIDASKYCLNDEIIQKIINEIKIHINPNIETFIICEDIVNNPIIQFMNDNNYTYMVNIKNDNLKENQLNDIITSNLCTDEFIGYFDYKKCFGSPITYFINKNINCNKKMIIE